MKKITLSEVYKKDLKVVVFLIINGGFAYVADQLKANILLSLILGAAANYIAFRAMQEASNEGYIRALK